MPTAEQIALIYDFERVMELALKGLFADQEIKAFTSQMVESSGDAVADAALVAAGWDLLNSQKDRPRVEIMFVPGAGAGQWTNKTFADPIGEIPIETSFKGQFKLDIITEADMRMHAAFRTMIRFIVHSQLTSVNGVQLPNHRIQFCFRDGGTTPVMKPQEGIFQTTLLFDIDFSIQDEAWDSLAN